MTPVSVWLSLTAFFHDINFWLVYLYKYHTNLLLTDCSIVFNNALEQKLLHSLIQVKSGPLAWEGCWQSLKMVLPSLILPHPGQKLCAMEEKLGVGKLSLHQPALLDPPYGPGAMSKAGAGTGATPAASVPWYR